jgi:hypothetical protein
MTHRWTSALAVGVCAAFALVGCGTNAPAGSGTPASARTGSAAVNGLGAIASTIDATDNPVFVPATLKTQVGVLLSSRTPVPCSTRSPSRIPMTNA